ncbi:MAG: hypothetical protein BJ554DRAFT_941, partial [Olpidium bornovanus]
DDEKEDEGDEGDDGDGARDPQARRGHRWGHAELEAGRACEGSAGKAGGRNGSRPDPGLFVACGHGASLPLPPSAPSIAFPVKKSPKQAETVGMAPSSTASSQESPLHAANADCNGGCTGADVDHARCTSPEEQRRTGEAASQADENTPGKPAAVGTACGKVDPGPGTATTAVESVAAESVAAESVAAESAPAEGAPDEGGADEGAPAEGGADEGAPAEGAPDEGGADEGAPDEGVADEGVPTEGVFAESETAGAENVRRGSEGARAGFPAEGWHNGGGLAAESTPAALSPDKRRRAGSEEEESQDLQQGRRDSQANCFRDDGDSHTAKKNKLSTDLSDPHSLAAPSGHETPREPDEEERTERGSTAGTSSPVAAVDIARQSGGDCSSPDRFVPRRRKKWDMGSPILLPKPRAESGPPRICSSIDDYKRVKFLGDGTFGWVATRGNCVFWPLDGSRVGNRRLGVTC